MIVPPADPEAVVEAVFLLIEPAQDANRLVVELVLAQVVGVVVLEEGPKHLALREAVNNLVSGLDNGLWSAPAAGARR